MNQLSDERKSFSADEANRMLPLISAITKDLAELSLQVSERRERISQLTSPHEKMTEGNPYAEEVEQIVKELERNSKELERFEAELGQLGVECRDRLAGIIAFPSDLAGNQIYLSWKLGEPEVVYWHGIDGDFDDRELLPASSIA